MKINNFIRGLHKIFGLLIGMQLLLWTITGLYFNTMDSQVTSGNITKTTTNIYNLEALSDTMLTKILANTTTPIDADRVTNISLYPLLTNSVAKISTTNQTFYFNYNQDSFAQLRIDESLAQEIAQQSYLAPKGDTSSIVDVSRLHKGNSDLPHNTQVLFKVSFADQWNTRVYIEADSGSVLRHYNDESWLQDMAFMLHFMDYQRVGSFNHWLIIASALLSVGLLISGLYWLFFLIAKGYYR